MAAGSGLDWHRGEVKLAKPFDKRQIFAVHIEIVDFICESS
jgi:hypothetical protein